MPESLYPNIIKSPVSPIHTDGDFLFFQIFDPSGTGKLRSLIRVYDLRLAMFVDCFTKHLQTAFGIQRVGYIPTDNIATIDIYDGRQIKETLAHWNIHYVNAPDLIQMGKFQSSESLYDLMFLDAPDTRDPSCFRINFYQTYSVVAFYGSIIVWK